VVVALPIALVVSAAVLERNADGLRLRSSVR
jgi:hypothetical protein